MAFVALRFESCNQLKIQTLPIWLVFCLFLVVLGLHCGAWASCCGGFSCCKAQALGYAGSTVVADRLSCSRECGIFLDQGLNPCHLHCKADSQSLATEETPLLTSDSLWIPAFIFQGLPNTSDGNFFDHFCHPKSSYKGVNEPYDIYIYYKPFLMTGSMWQNDFGVRPTRLCILAQPLSS